MKVLKLQLGKIIIYIGQGSNDQTLENYNEWTVLGNKTKTNCAYQAYYISEFCGVHKNVASMSTKLKQRMNPKNKLGSGFNELKEMAIERKEI